MKTTNCEKKTNYRNTLFGNCQGNSGGGASEGKLRRCGVRVSYGGGEMEDTCGGGVRILLLLIVCETQCLSNWQRVRLCECRELQFLYLLNV